MVKSMILFKNILARILKNNLDFFSRLFFKIILPKSWKIILKVSDRVRGGVRGGESPPPNRPILIFFKIAFLFQDFLETKIKIIFQDFGNKILKMNLEKKSRSFFKILAKICLNKIIDFTIYLYGGAKRPPIFRS